MDSFLCLSILSLMLALSTTAFRSSFSSSRAATKPATTLLNSPSSESKDLDRSISETKQRLFAQCAACDRGFGAVERERTEITMLVNQLSALCVDKNTTRGLFPDTSYVDCPIEGCWKLIYTDALDVLSLAASPFTLLQGIYQKIDRDGSSVNIIDLAPRLQALLPPSLVGAGSTLRLRVGTSARARSEKRVGLTFRSVEAAPLSLAGQSVSFLPPLQVNLPQATLFGSNSDGGLLGNEGPGYFDVLYLDQSCLIITQNAPGGIFVSIRDDSSLQ